MSRWWKRMRERPVYSVWRGRPVPRSARGLASAPARAARAPPGPRVFAVIGYGCTTCAGKSGPLKPLAARAVEQDGRAIAAVLSGNRNFDGRIHRLVGANYLCSPALVVAFALAGRVAIDIDSDPIANDPNGAP